MSLLKNTLDSINNKNIESMYLNYESALASLEKDSLMFDNCDNNLDTLLNITKSSSIINIDSEVLNTESAKMMMETYVATTNAILGFEFFQMEEGVTIESAIGDGVKKAWEFIKKLFLQMINYLKEMGTKIKAIFSKLVGSKTVEETVDNVEIIKQLETMKSSFKDTPEETVVEKEIDKDTKIEVVVVNKKIQTVRVYKRAQLRNTIKREEKIDTNKELQTFAEENFTKEFLTSLSNNFFKSKDYDMHDVLDRFVFGFGDLKNNDKGALKTLETILENIKKIDKGDKLDFSYLENIPLPEKMNNLTNDDYRTLEKNKISNYNMDRFNHFFSIKKEEIFKNIDNANDYVVKINSVLGECYKEILKQERNITTNEDIEYVNKIKHYLTIYKNYSESVLKCVTMSIKTQAFVSKLYLKTKLV